MLVNTELILLLVRQEPEVARLAHMLPFFIFEMYFSMMGFYFFYFFFVPSPNQDGSAVCEDLHAGSSGECFEKHWVTVFVQACCALLACWISVSWKMRF